MLWLLMWHVFIYLLFRLKKPGIPVTWVGVWQGYKYWYPYPYPSIPAAKTRTGLCTPEAHYLWPKQRFIPLLAWWEWCVLINIDHWSVVVVVVTLLSKSHDFIYGLMIPARPVTWVRVWHGYEYWYPYPYPCIPVTKTRTGLRTRDIH
jgi:hypothetical protein